MDEYLENEYIEPEEEEFSNELEKALRSFFENEILLAQDAGYEFSVWTNDTQTDVDVSLDIIDPANKEVLPKVNVYARKRESGSFYFVVDVEFPDLDLDRLEYTMKECLDMWEPVADLADGIESVEFIPSQWL